ncbi:MAG: T9SS type A sorting domain-containing protein [Chitinophagaceae bacterium]
MKHFTHIFIIQIFLSGIFNFSKAQTLNYTTVNYSTSLCNVFNVSPARVVGGLTHYPVSGGVSYNGSALVLETKGGQGLSTTLGTAYAIAIPIKQGYSYNITVNASKQSSDPVSAPTFEIGAINTLPNPNTTNPTACGAVDQNKWAVLQSTTIGYSYINTTSAQNYPILQNFVANANLSYFTILAHSGSQSQSSTVLINSITITETAPTPTFTITPSSTPIVCGSTTPVGFTVNNGSGTSGITDYSWNLGATPNGWLLPNGTAAPATYSTGTTNTLTLTPVCGAVQKNVSATVTANGSSYNTNVSTASVTQPSLSISGSSVICSGSSNYSVTGLPCNASVVWSIIPATSVANLSCSSCATTSLSYINNGAVTLTATVSNVCGGTITISKSNIIIGIPTIQSGFYTYTNYPYGSPMGLVEGPEDNEVCYTERPTVMTTTMDIQGATDVVWEKNSSTPSTLLWDQVGNDLSISFRAVNQTGSFKITTSNTCGSVSKDYIFKSVTCEMFRVSPNPASSNFTVSTIEDNSIAASKEYTSNRSFTEIRIFDMQSNLKKYQRFNKAKQATINISDLKLGIYIVEVSNGIYKERHQLSVQN